MFFILSFFSCLVCHWSGLAPGVRQHLPNVRALGHVAVQHAADEVDALGAHGKGNAQVQVHDLVDAVKGVLLVDDGVQENAQRPHVLRFAAIGLASQDFGGCVIY